jgi:hypothetical protein
MEQNSTLTALHISGNNASDATVRALKKSIARNRKSHNLTTKGNITNTTNDNSGNNGNRNAALSLESKDASSTGSKQEEENTVRTPLDPESLEVRRNFLSVLHRLMH